MKYLYLLGSLLLIGMLIIACGQDDSPPPPPTDTSIPIVEATAMPKPPDTPTPTVKVTATAQPTDTPEPVLEASEETDRPYRSYPAPTGRPGFRLYYQKRCYPGCHYGNEPDKVHP